MVRCRRCLGRFPVLLCLCALSLLGTGCHIQNCEMVEMALRDRECKLRELTVEVDRLRSQNAALERELGVTRDTASAKTTLPTPELASQTYALTSIELGMQTGGYNNDRDLGDEALQVVLLPRDPQKDSIKAPGTMDVFAYEVSKEGLKKLLCSWRVSPDQLSKTWRASLLGTGYYVKLPWKVFPTVEKMRIVVRFTLADGRSFEADKDIKVKLVELQNQKLQPSEYPDVPVLPEPRGGEAPLPMPRKDEPPLAPKDSKEPEGPQITPKTGTTEPASHWQAAQTPPPLTAAVRLLTPVPSSESMARQRRPGPRP
jgi:hypothetical protein